MIGVKYLSYLSMEEKCKVCKGTGKITVYRSDLEEFEIIDCPKCKQSTIKKNNN